MTSPILPSEIKSEKDREGDIPKVSRNHDDETRLRINELIPSVASPM